MEDLLSGSVPWTDEEAPPQGTAQYPYLELIRQGTPICSLDLKFGFWIDRPNNYWWFIQAGVWRYCTLHEDDELTEEWWKLYWTGMEWQPATQPVVNAPPEVKDP